MRTVFAIRMHRVLSASIVVVLAGVTVAAWILFWDPAASNAAPSLPVNVDPATVAANLETLHQRAMARSNDEDDAKPVVPGGHTIKPEQAAALARTVAVAGGDPTSKLNYIELQPRGGTWAWAVRIGTSFVYIDADTGAVVP
jgi:uncharacterized iron-regulated membrane protein